MADGAERSCLVCRMESTLKSDYRAEETVRKGKDYAAREKPWLPQASSWLEPIPALLMLLLMLMLLNISPAKERGVMLPVTTRCAPL